MYPSYVELCVTFTIALPSGVIVLLSFSLLCVLLTNYLTKYLFYKLLQCIPGPVPSAWGGHNNRHLLTYFDAMSDLY